MIDVRNATPKRTTLRSQSEGPPIQGPASAAAAANPTSRPARTLAAERQARSEWERMDAAARSAWLDAETFSAVRVAEISR